MKKAKCFVIMPFSPTRHGESTGERRITRKQWDHIFERWIKKAIEAYRPTRYTCKRSSATPGNFVKGIIADLGDSELVIADLTGEKPNVYYELGIRHTLRTGTVIITQHLTALPSDLAGYYAFEYTYSERDYEYEALYRQFEKELHEKISALEETDQLSDSPVSDFLGLRHELLRRNAEEEASALRWLLTNLKGTVIKNCEICEDLAAMAEAAAQVEAGPDEPKLRHTPFIDLFHVEALYERLLTGGWSIFPEDSLQTLVNVINGIRESLLLFQKYWDRIELGKEGGLDSLDTLQTLGRAITSHRVIFEEHWDGLVETLSDVKLKKIKNRRRKKP